MKSYIMDIRDSLLDSFDAHRKLWVGGIVGVFSVIIAIMIGSYFINANALRTFQTQSVAVVEAGQTLLDELDGLYADANRLYPKDGITVDQLTDYSSQFEEWRTYALNLADRAPKLKESMALQNQLKSNVETVQNRLDDLKTRITSKDAISQLFQKSPIENDQVLNYPIVKPDITIDVIESVMKSVARPSDEFYIVLHQLKDYAWSQTDLKADITELVDEVKNANAGSEGRLIVLQKLLLELEKLSDVKYADSIRFQFSNDISMIIDHVFGGLLDAIKTEDGTITYEKVSGINGGELDDASINLLALMLYYQGDAMQYLGLDLNAIFPILVGENKYRDASEFVSNYISKRKGYRDASNKTGTYEHDLFEITPSDFYYSRISKLESLAKKRDKALEGKVTNSSSNTENQSGQNPATASQVLLLWNSYRYYQKDDGSIVYSKTGSIADVRPFNASEIVFVLNDTAYYYHPVEKVLYTVDALGSVVMFDAALMNEEGYVPTQFGTSSNGASSDLNSQGNNDPSLGTPNPNPNGVVR